MNSILRPRLLYRSLTSIQHPSHCQRYATRSDIPFNKSKGHGRQSKDNDLELALRGRPDEDNIPLASDATRISLRQLEGSTITPKEREVFQRLFKNVLHKAQSQNEKDQATHGTQDNNSQPEGLGGALQAYPAALRGIALGTAEKLEYYKYRSKLKDALNDDNVMIIRSEQDKSKVAELKAGSLATVERITDLIEEAKTDANLWQILEDELFDSISALKFGHADAGSASKAVEKSGASQSSAKAQSDKGNSKQSGETQPPKSNVDLLLTIEPVYPKLLVVAAQKLRTKFPSSLLVFSILPRVKKLGDASYALGATIELYRELIAATWSTTGDFQLVNEILQEMDQGGFEFDEETLRLVRSIRKEYRSNARNGMTWVVSQMTLMQQGYDKLTWWKNLIQERLEAEALRQANLKIREHTM